MYDSLSEHHTPEAHHSKTTQKAHHRHANVQKKQNSSAGMSTKVQTSVWQLINNCLHTVYYKRRKSCRCPHRYPTSKSGKLMQSLPYVQLQHSLRTRSTSISLFSSPHSTLLLTASFLRHKQRGRERERGGERADSHMHQFASQSSPLHTQEEEAGLES